MNNLTRLIKPYGHESVFYVASAAGVLVVSNFERLWLRITNNISGSDSSTGSVAGTAQNWSSGFDTSLSQDMISIIIWITISLIFIFGIILITYYINVGAKDFKRLILIRKMRRSSLNSKEFLSGWFLRLVGLILLIIWVQWFFGSFFKTMSDLFYESLFMLSEPLSLPKIVTSVVLMGIGLYLFAVCFRLITLKIRVFSK